MRITVVAKGREEEEAVLVCQPLEFSCSIVVGRQSCW